MKSTIDDPQSYIAKLAPVYVELFRTAHAIVGNIELAEYVLKKVAYVAWQRRAEWHERMSFREGLGQTVRMVALAELENIRSVGSFDVDWSLLTPDADALSPEQRQIHIRLLRESPELNRALMLYYGCGLRIGQIAQVMGMKNAQVRDMLYMFRTRLERSRIRAGKRHMMEDNLEQLLLLMLRTDGNDVPASGALFRAFERDAALAPKPRRSAGRLVAAALLTVGALICAVLFWLVAVLMEPAAAPPPRAETELTAVLIRGGEPTVTKSQHETNANCA